MPSDPLASARAKLERAEELLCDFQEMLREDWRRNLYGIKAREDLALSQTIVLAAKPDGLFTRYAIAAGEIVHHMRSALEHAIWQLNPNPKHGVTGFPVFGLERQDRADPQRRYYERDGLRMIDGLGSAASAVVRELQPFATGPDQRLSIMNDMWNSDKHRLLNMMVILPQGFSPYYRYLSNGDALFLPTVPIPDVDDGDEIARIPLPTNFVAGQVRFEAELAITIRFTEGPAKGESPEELLFSLLRFSRGAIEALGRTI